MTYHAADEGNAGRTGRRLGRLSTLLCTYDDQILQQKPYWEAKYTEALGALEQQCYAAFVRSAELCTELAKIEERIRKCLSALERLEQEHPFKHRALLENPQAVDERKTELKHQIAYYMAECRDLGMQLAMMMQGRGGVVH